MLCYVNDCINCRVLGAPCDSVYDFEVLWVSLRPKLLPRPISIMILAVIYCPPWYAVDTKRSLSKYIVKCVDDFTRRYPNAGFFVVGDFNSLDTSMFNKYLYFKQIVTKGTRESNSLDKIFTNCCEFYDEPVILPPLGKSDHNCVLVNTNNVNRVPVGHAEINRRFLMICHTRILLVIC